MLWAKKWTILLCNTEEPGTYSDHRHKKCSKVNITNYIQLCFLDVFPPGMK